MSKNLTLNRRQFVGGAAAAGLASTLPAPAVWAQQRHRDRALELARRIGRRDLGADDRRLQRGAQGQGRLHQDGGRPRGAVHHQGATPRPPPAARRISAGARRACAPRWSRTACSCRSTTSSSKSGLDLADFSEFSIKQARYPKYDNGLFMIPMDLMSLQPEVNIDHVKEAGLRPGRLPAGRRDAARMGGEDDEARGRHRHALGHHDDRARACSRR